MAMEIFGFREAMDKDIGWSILFYALFVEKI
jgi:hypothetical protein